jgi:hypothetical protein
MLRLGGIVFIVAAVLVSFPATEVRGIGAVLLVYSIILMGLSPWLLRLIHMGKFWEQQCWFFGRLTFTPSAIRLQ